ncbi:unnamed protein product [Allacma fusca]|uniref:Uncharacterized protein n=1 Tax=Allacma fusca TaxID=39272 RepID=A0A8J2J677_9HEXA|nr:unnamed protein product [Allacma fusca]
MDFRGRELLFSYNNVHRSGARVNGVQNEDKIFASPPFIAIVIICYLDNLGIFPLTTILYFMYPQLPMVTLSKILVPAEEIFGVFFVAGISSMFELMIATYVLTKLRIFLYFFMFTFTHLQVVLPSTSRIKEANSCHALKAHIKQYREGEIFAKLANDWWRSEIMPILSFFFTVVFVFVAYMTLTQFGMQRNQNLLYTVMSSAE